MLHSIKLVIVRHLSQRPFLVPRKSDKTSKKNWPDGNEVTTLPSHRPLGYRKLGKLTNETWV